MENKSFKRRLFIQLKGKHEKVAITEKNIDTHTKPNDVVIALIRC